MNQYRVVDANDRPGALIDERQLYDYVRDGTVQPDTIIIDETANTKMIAGRHPRLIPIFRQSGIAIASPPQPVQQRPAPRPGTGDILRTPGDHAPWLALVLCIFLWGAGQMYNRQVLKGIAVTLLLIALVKISILLQILVWVCVCVDAYTIGRKINEGREVGYWETF